MPISKKSNRKQALLALLVVSAIWGVATPVIKVTLEFIPPISFLLIRFTLASLILYFLVDWKKGYLKNLGSKGLVYAFLLGALGSSLNLGLYFYGVTYTTAIEATIIYSSAPIWILLGGVIFLGEKVTKKELIGLLVIILGFSVIIFRPILESGYSNQVSLKGNLLVLLAVLSWTAYSIISKKVFNGDKTEERYSPVFITFITFFAGAVTLIPFGIYEILTVPMDLKAGTPGMIYMIIASSVVAYTLYEYGVKKIEVSEAGLFQYLQIVFAVPIAMLFLGEQFSAIDITGIIFIIAGLFVAEHTPIKRKQ